MEDLISSALGQGLYAALFVFLLSWVLRKNEEREAAFQKLLENQAGVLQDISNRLLTLDTRLAHIESFSERSVISYGQEWNRRFQVAGNDSVESGETGWSGLRNYSGSSGSDSRPQL